MFQEHSEKIQFFYNYSNYNDINEDFDFYNQKNIL
jgi:hypothetical protein